MPSESKKKRDAKKKEAAKARLVKKPQGLKAEADQANGDCEDDDILEDVNEIANGIEDPEEDEVNIMTNNFTNVDIQDAAVQRSCTGKNGKFSKHTSMCTVKSWFTHCRGVLSDFAEKNFVRANMRNCGKFFTILPSSPLNNYILLHFNFRSFGVTPSLTRRKDRQFHVYIFRHGIADRNKVRIKFH